MFWLPNIDLFVADHFTPLQNYLLSRIELCHKRFSSVTAWVTRNFLLDMLSELQVLIDLSVHLQACLIGWLREELRNLNSIFGCEHITALRCAQAPLIEFAELPVAIAHLLVKIEGLAEVTPQESQAHFVL